MPQVMAVLEQGFVHLVVVKGCVQDCRGPASAAVAGTARGGRRPTTAPAAAGAVTSSGLAATPVVYTGS